MYSINKNKGFTLIEAIISMVIFSLIAITSFSYFKSATDITFDMQKQSHLSQESIFVQNKLEQELKNALPNSIRTSTSGTDSCIEFIPVKASGFYTSAPVGAASNSITAQLNTNVDCTSCTDYVAINTETTGDIYAQNTIAPIQTISTTTEVNITLDSSHTFPADSPTKKLYITGEPVSICTSGTTLGLLRSIPISVAMGAFTAGHVVISNILSTDIGTEPLFNISNGNTTDNGYTSLNLHLKKDNTVFNSINGVQVAHDL